jgi:hypothetical protein
MAAEMEASTVRRPAVRNGRAKTAGGAKMADSAKQRRRTLEEKIGEMGNWGSASRVKKKEEKEIGRSGPVVARGGPWRRRLQHAPSPGGIQSFSKKESLNKLACAPLQSTATHDNRAAGQRVGRKKHKADAVHTLNQHGRKSVR